MLPRVRHATADDLDRVERLLAQLRAVPGLRERKRGSFSRGSRAFLHFHADGDDQIYVDVRFGPDFERLRVTDAAEQAEFMARVNASLRPT